MGSASLTNVNRSNRDKKTVIFSFHSTPFRNEVKRTFPIHKNGMCMERTQWNVQSTTPLIARTKMTPQEPKKAKSIAQSKQSHLESIRVDWHATQDRSIFNSRLQTQSCFDCRTHSKSKTGSSELPQNSLEDRSSMKLLIPVGE